MEILGLQGSEEALDGRVVQAIALAAHALFDLLQQIAQKETGLQNPFVVLMKTLGAALSATSPTMDRAGSRPPSINCRTMVRA